MLAAVPRSQEGGGVWGMTSGTVVLVRGLDGARLGVETTIELGVHGDPGSLCCLASPSPPWDCDVAQAKFPFFSAVPCGLASVSLPPQYLL